MFCHGCGKEIINGEHYCRNCGTKVRYTDTGEQHPAGDMNSQEIYSAHADYSHEQKRASNDTVDYLKAKGREIAEEAINDGVKASKWLKKKAVILEKKGREIAEEAINDGIRASKWVKKQANELDYYAFIGPTYTKKVKKVFITTVIILFTYTVVLFVVSLLVYFDKLDVPMLNDIFISMGIKEPEVRTAEVPEITENENMDIENQGTFNRTILTDQYSVTLPDAEEYFENNSKVLYTLDVASADTALSESEVYDFLESRGFDEYEILTDYTIDGKFNNDMSISQYSSDKHPIYTIRYSTPDGDMWSIMVVNDSVYAVPVTFNMQDTASAPVMLSETDQITSYDSTTNTYYITHPNEEVLSVKRINLINSETLDAYSKGVFR